jgi:hypothetical protein
MHVCTDVGMDRWRERGVAGMENPFVFVRYFVVTSTIGVPLVLLRRASIIHGNANTLRLYLFVYVFILCMIDDSCVCDMRNTRDPFCSIYIYKSNKPTRSTGEAVKRGEW